VVLVKEEKLSLAEMKKRYKNEWLLIANYETNDAKQVQRGIVIAHSPQREVIYKKMMEMKGSDLAIEYTGEIAKDEVYML